MTALALLVFPDLLPIPHATAAYAQAAPQGATGEMETLRAYTPEELKAALATLSDESASELLLAALNQLAVNATEAVPDAAARTGIAGVMKHLETVYTMTPSRLKAVIAGSAALPSELGRVFDRMTGGKGGGRLIFLLAGIAAILMASYGLEKILRRTVINFGDTVAIPKMGGLEKFGAALLAILPALLGSPAENPVVLTNQDLFGPGAATAYSSHSRMSRNPQEEPDGYGVWNVQVYRSGTYRITLRFEPIGRDVPVPLKAGTAIFKLGNAAAEQSIQPGSRLVSFEIHLDESQGPLESYFTGQRQDGEKVTPFFVEVEFLETEGTAARSIGTQLQERHEDG